MKNARNRVLTILAWMVAAVFVGGILFLTASFMGNPITVVMADKAIKQYVEQNYSSLDLETGKAKYNFKDGTYMARAASKTSVDTKFAIYYRDGRVQRDDYEVYVSSMFNTLRRLSAEYAAIAKKTIDEELGYINSYISVMYAKDEYKNASDDITLDMKFDKALPIKAEITITLPLADISLESVAKVLVDIHQVLVDNGYPFYQYSLHAEADEMLVAVNGVTPVDIEGGELASLLEKAKNAGGEKGISVFTKGEKK